MAGTTGGGAFRYPTEHTNYTEPLRQALHEAGISEDLIEEWNSLTMDRDRALEDYLTVAAQASGNFFDAIVDGNLTASDTANNLYIDIGEAIIALGAAGKTNVTIGVRPAGATAYQEAANITSGVPARVRIIGAGPHPAMISTPTTNGVVWDLRGRRIEFTEVHIENIVIRSSNALNNGATDLFNSASLTNLTLVNCEVLSNSTFMNQLNGVSVDCRTMLINTALLNMSFGRARWVYMLGGDVTLSSSYTFTTMYQNNSGPTGGTGVCYMSGVIIVPSNTVTVTWTNTNGAVVAMAGCFLGADRGFTQLIPTTATFNLQFSSSTRPMLDLHWGGNINRLTITLTAPSNGWDVTLRGHHTTPSSATSIFTKTGTNFGTFRGTVAKLDVTGGARIEASLNSAVSVTGGNVLLRGQGINADITIQSATTTTAIQGIGLTDSLIRASHVTFTTSNQMWTLDATSQRNICDFAGASRATNPGVDSGVANLIRQT